MVGTWCIRGFIPLMLAVSEKCWFYFKNHPGIIPDSFSYLLFPKLFWRILLVPINVRLGEKSNGYANHAMYMHHQIVLGQ